MVQQLKGRMDEIEEKITILDGKVTTLPIKLKPAVHEIAIEILREVAKEMVTDSVLKVLAKLKEDQITLREILKEDQE
jgi:hypothetical protein